ncbi:hypothetical protein SAXI111661_20505 [Saccharomonospora xinjiangensis]|nr:hypothetical protein [Saccharomonospora xinjiangensis]QBQ59012.1 hypothetical protein EYD13_03160 [Saccharomonospora xinjiangensis]
METAVIGTVIGDALLATLRRMAHADVSARLFGGGEEINRPESG